MRQCGCNFYDKESCNSHQIKTHCFGRSLHSENLLVHGVSSVDQVADIFTKALSKDRVAILRDKLQVRPPFQLAGEYNQIQEKYNSMPYGRTYGIMLCLLWTHKEDPMYPLFISFLYLTFKD
ncbi:hypothetical protein LXL04_001073 [Taraxacum kok-saghyz]